MKPSTKKFLLFLLYAAALVAMLVTLYLYWAHPTLRLFDEELFIEDLIACRNRYCSSLLLNCVLAYASVGGLG